VAPHALLQTRSKIAAKYGLVLIYLWAITDMRFA
jgi:hypothetical protein